MTERTTPTHHAAPPAAPGTTRTIAAGAFNATCLGLMNGVRDRRCESVVTKRGKPVAKLARSPGRRAPRSHYFRAP